MYGYSGSSGYVGDPTLTLYDYYDSGHFFPLASNDDRLIGAYPLDSHITYTPGYTGWYELDVGAFLNAHTGVYLLGT